MRTDFKYPSLALGVVFVVMTITLLATWTTGRVTCNKEPCCSKDPPSTVDEYDPDPWVELYRTTLSDPMPKDYDLTLRTSFRLTPKVVFFVPIDHRSVSPSNTGEVWVGVQNLILSLQLQSRKNWVAVFFNRNNSDPVDLERFMRFSYNDRRLLFVPDLVMGKVQKTGWHLPGYDTDEATRSWKYFPQLDLAIEWYKEFIEDLDSYMVVTEPTSEYGSTFVEQVELFEDDIIQVNFMSAKTFYDSDMHPSRSPGCIVQSIHQKVCMQNNVDQEVPIGANLIRLDKYVEAGLRYRHLTADGLQAASMMDILIYELDWTAVNTGKCLMSQFPNAIMCREKGGIFEQSWDSANLTCWKRSSAHIQEQLSSEDVLFDTVQQVYGSLAALGDSNPPSPERDSTILCEQNLGQPLREVGVGALFRLHLTLRQWRECWYTWLILS